MEHMQVEIFDIIQNLTLIILELYYLELICQLNEILIGLLLGDLYVLNRSKTISSVILIFTQGLLHKDYLMHLYNKFKDFCGTEPKLSNLLPHKLTGLVYSRIMFNTFSLSCFNEFHSLFYSAGTKIVPLNIGDLLTPLSLAYWLADDGCFHIRDSDIYICTNGFTYEETNLLISVLKNNFKLECSPILQKNK